MTEWLRAARERLEQELAALEQVEQNMQDEIAKDAMARTETDCRLQPGWYDIRVQGGGPQEEEEDDYEDMPPLEEDDEDSNQKRANAWFNRQ